MRSSALLNDVDADADRAGVRNKIHDLSRLRKELTGRTRSRRYFAAVRDVQCGRLADTINGEPLGILTLCGHQVR